MTTSPFLVDINPRSEHAKDFTSSSIEVYEASPQQRIMWIKAGVPARSAKIIMSKLTIGQGAVQRALNLSPATLNKKAAKNETLSIPDSERFVGFVKLIGQLEMIVQESGDSDGFSAYEWMSRWLGEPVPALGGAKPIDLMDTMEGQNLVSTTLAQIQSGAYA